MVGFFIFLEALINQKKYMKKEDLLNKWYYRLIKVIYIFFHVIIISILFLVAYNERPKVITDYENSKIFCSNGTKIVGENTSLYYISSSDEKRFNDMCKVREKLANDIYYWRQEGISDTEILNKFITLYPSSADNIAAIITKARVAGKNDTDVINKMSEVIGGKIVRSDSELYDTLKAGYHVDYKYKTIGSWKKIIIILIIGLAIIILIMELLRRIFLYVITGKFK